MRLGIEPLHPMMVGERSAIVTLGEALALAERFDDPAVGVVVDAYHVFWDPLLDEQVARAHGLSSATTSPTGSSRRPTCSPAAG